MGLLQHICLQVGTTSF